MVNRCRGYNRIGRRVLLVLLMLGLSGMGTAEIVYPLKSFDLHAANADLIVVARVIRMEHGSMMWNEKSQPVEHSSILLDGRATYAISVLHILKGTSTRQEISVELADKRLEPPPWSSMNEVMDAENSLSGGIVIGSRYLLFLNKSARSEITPYDWQVRGLGSTLPVSPLFDPRKLEGRTLQQSVRAILDDQLEYQERKLQYTQYYTDLLRGSLLSRSAAVVGIVIWVGLLACVAVITARMLALWSAAKSRWTVGVCVLAFVLLSYLSRRGCLLLAGVYDYLFSAPDLLGNVPPLAVYYVVWLAPVVALLLGFFVFARIRQTLHGKDAC